MSLRAVPVLSLLLLVACSTPRPSPAEPIEVGRPPPAPLASAPPAPSSAPTPAPAPTPAQPAVEPAPVVAESPSADEAALREAVFRHMFGKNASGMQGGARVFCLAFEKDADPPAAFLARFQDVKIPVRPTSGCTHSASKGVVDKATGARGLAFRIDSVTRKDADHAEIEGGYYEAGLSASGNLYTLERKAGRWVVTKDQMRWIS